MFNSLIIISVYIRTPRILWCDILADAKWYFSNPLRWWLISFLVHLPVNKKSSSFFWGVQVLLLVTTWQSAVVILYGCVKNCRMLQHSSQCPSTNNSAGAKEPLKPGKQATSLSLSLFFFYLSTTHTKIKVISWKTHDHNVLRQWKTTIFPLQEDIWISHWSRMTAFSPFFCTKIRLGNIHL